MMILTESVSYLEKVKTVLRFGLVITMCEFGGNRQRLCSKRCAVCFNRSFASHPRSKFWDKSNNNLRPRDVFIGSNKKYKFICPDCEHDFEMVLNCISNQNQWCPYCSSRSHKLCSSKECIMCFNKSFASHSKAVCWSTEYNKVQPREVFKNSHTKFWFVCDNNNCSHIFQIRPNSITSSGHWCPYCSKHALRLCSHFNCDACFKRSFASHPKAIWWHSEYNKLKPRSIFLNTHKKFWFVCNNTECNHEFETSPHSMTNSGSGCPYCCIAPRMMCSADLKCDICFKKSFASHPKAQFWNLQRNILQPRDVTISSGNKFWFTCDSEKCGQEFEIQLNNVSCHGHWCPYCKNKTENMLYRWLINNKFVVKRQVKFKWCKNFSTGKLLPFDFLIGNTIIELDGKQHFEQISNWQSAEATQLKDCYKERTAIRNSHSIIRLLQEEVWNTLKDKNTNTEYTSTAKWQTILLDMLSNRRDVSTITLISGNAMWPGEEGHHIINVSHETRLIFVDAMKTII